jgi:hypothetical protein
MSEFNRFSEFNCTAPEFDKMDLIRLQIAINIEVAKVEMVKERVVMCWQMAAFGVWTFFCVELFVLAAINGLLN